MSDLGLGKIITTEQHRDAIHVAVCPITAKQTLYPGQRVDQHGDPNGKHVGIIDPYLTGPIYAEQRCWLFLFPNTVTSLRHEWTHPAFGTEEAKVANDSEIWLRAYAMRMNSYDKPEEAYQRLLEGLRNKELFAHGSDLHGRFDLDDEEDLRFHAEKVLGSQINFDDFQFTCSC